MITATIEMPTRVGSPAFTVIAAIPLGHGNEYVCTVITRHGFGTVHAYRHAGSDMWHATAGHYDIEMLQDAIHDMCERAGIPIKPRR
jgi:hypothetical protein